MDFQSCPFSGAESGAKQEWLRSYSVLISRKNHTWYQIAKISWFDLSDDRFFAKRIIIGTYTINDIVARLSESGVQMIVNA